MFVNSALRDLRFEFYYTQSFQYLGTLKMDESTIFESAESEIRKKKIKAANPLAGQADDLLARHAMLLPHQGRVTNP